MSILQGPSSAQAYPSCHREERSDVAISFPQQRSLPPMELPRFARNDGSSETGYG